MSLFVLSNSVDIQFLSNQTVRYETFRGVVLLLRSTKVVRGKSPFLSIPIRDRSKQLHTVHLVAMGTSRYYIMKYCGSGSSSGRIFLRKNDWRYFFEKDSTDKEILLISKIKYDTFTLYESIVRSMFL